MDTENLPATIEIPLDDAPIIDLSTSPIQITHKVGSSAASSIIDTIKNKAIEMFWTIFAFIARIVSIDEKYAHACHKCCSSLEMNCFDLFRFMFFILGTTIIPYITYQIVADKLKWTERRKKTFTQHFETVMTAVASAVTLWFLGNYENTFDWISFIFVHVGMLLFGYVTEMPELHHSLTTVSTWGTKMWAVMGSLVAIILGFTGYHIYLSTKMPGGFWKVYVACLLIPIGIAYISHLAVEKQNEDPLEPKRSILHLHHVHIFYALAFFTRFPDLASRIAAGLVIGCSLQGAAAYNYDTTFEHKLKPVDK